MTRKPLSHVKILIYRTGLLGIQLNGIICLSDFKTRYPVPNYPAIYLIFSAMTQKNATHTYTPRSSDTDQTKEVRDVGEMT